MKEGAVPDDAAPSQVIYSIWVSLLVFRCEDRFIVKRVARSRHCIGRTKPGGQGKCNSKSSKRRLHCDIPFFIVCAGGQEESDTRWLALHLGRCQHKGRKCHA